MYFNLFCELSPIHGIIIIPDDAVDQQKVEKLIEIHTVVLRPHLKTAIIYIDYVDENGLYDRCSEFAWIRQSKNLSAKV